MHQLLDLAAHGSAWEPMKPRAFSLGGGAQRRQRRAVDAMLQRLRADATTMLCPGGTTPSGCVQHPRACFSGIRNSPGLNPHPHPLSCDKGGPVNCRKRPHTTSPASPPHTCTSCCCSRERAASTCCCRACALRCASWRRRSAFCAGAATSKGGASTSTLRSTQVDEHMIAVHAVPAA